MFAVEAGHVRLAALTGALVLHLAGLRSSPQSVATGFEIYRRGDYVTASRVLANTPDWSAFARELAQRVPDWPAKPAAAFALESAAALLQARLQECSDFDVVADMLTTGFRRLEVSEVGREFVLSWSLAMAALAQGCGGEAPPLAGRGSSYRGAAFEVGLLPIDEALTSLEGSAELRLGRAHLMTRGLHTAFADGWFSLGGKAYLNRRGDREFVQDLQAAGKEFAPLLDEPSVAADALLQTAFFRWLSGDAAGALAGFARVERATDDSWLRYLATFLASRVLVESGRRADAEAALRHALALKPAAQSAVRNLAALLYLRNEGDSASRLLTDALARPGATDDPWPSFAYGQYRLWPSRLARLRESIR